jgi:pyruvate formate lyase activating enzyme
MKIGAINKTSLLDYPAKLSAMIGVQGCNMHCPYCHNSHLIPYEFTKHSQRIEQEAFFSFLDERKNFLDGVVITGGEPTIQSDLPEFCDKIKKIGLSVKIDTNGTNPHALNHLLKNRLVNYIAMDIKADLDQYNQLFKENIDVNEILKSIDIIMSSDQPYEFRTTCISPFVTTDNIDQIGRLIKGARSFFLQKGNLTKHMVRCSEYESINENRLAELKHKAESYVLNCAIR